MKRILIITALLCTSFFANSQNVSNVSAQQDGDKIKISYTLDKEADVTLYVSEDGGKTFGKALQFLSGDVGINITPGNKTVVWNVLAEREKLWSEKIAFKVSTSAAGARRFTVNGVSFDMIKVQGGSFDMGDYSKHRVTLSDYYIGKYEVTQELWQAVMGASTSLSNPSRFKGSTNPVEQVSWDDCQEFIRKLNSLTGQTFRLPTEAEWEFAACGGNKSNGYKYSGSNNLDAVGWNWNNSGDRKTVGDWNNYEQVSSINCRAHPVGQKSPNELGIYDMSGNVLEWCGDRYGDYSSSAQRNPTGANSGSYRVLRGGGWYSDASGCRVSNRINRTPSSRYYHIGFRLALVQ